MNCKSVPALLIIALVSISSVFAGEHDDSSAQTHDNDDKSMNLYKKMIARRREV